MVFVCENNFYATNSHQSARQSGCRISDSAASFDARGHCVDGNDALAVYKGGLEAVSLARKGGGPSLIEAKTYRWKGHVGPDEDWTKGCRPKEELDYWKGQCPVKRFTELLNEKGALTSAEVEDMKLSITAEIIDAVEFARKSAYPEASALLADVYREASK